MSTTPSIQSKRASDSISKTSNVVPLDGEIIVIKKGNQTPYDISFKVGDGVTPLKNLKEASGSGTIGDATEFTETEITKFYSS